MENIKKKLGQVDTPKHIAEALVKIANPKFDIFYDLGAGKGNLSSPIHHQSGVLIELDINRFNYLKSLGFKNLQILNKDFLKKDFDFSSNKHDESVFFISNPPFHRGNSGHIFKKFHVTNQYHQLDLAFLDKVLSVSNNNSSLLFIMSSPFIEFASFKKFRETFINEFEQIEVISLCDKTYKNTEVESYAVIAHKIKRSINAEYQLSSMDIDGNIVDRISLTRLEAIESLSYSFHKQKSQLFRQIGTNHDTIFRLIKDLRRGSKTNKFFKESGIQAIHTTHLIEKKLHLDNNINNECSKYNLAQEHDILISRVGKRSIAKESLVHTGSDYFTDSVFKISPKTVKDSHILWSSISSNIGKTWREIYAQGKCAKYLTVESIFNMPIIF